MPIEMPRGLPFSVDTWTPASDRKRHHFLTHAHKDHLAGIVAHAYRPIYATRLTKTLALHYHPQLDDSLFVEIEVGGSVVVDDPDGAFTVTAVDANHCPGAVMFLFEGGFGNILHTGDCRLTPDCLQNLPMKYIVKKGRGSECHLDYLFLDCTFSKCYLKMPINESAVQQVISCIWKHPNAPVVYLSCDLLGREQILVEVSKTFGSKIFVDKSENPDFFYSLLLAAPEILSEDASSRFRLLGLPRLYEKANEELAKARANLQPEPLFIRPSAQWYATNPDRNKSKRRNTCPAEAERDEVGVWHVCHTMHSSREELESALQFLKPQWVISTTPPSRAMDLDYVKNNCYKTNLSSDDPLWKLLKGFNEKSTPTPAASETPRNNSTPTSVIEVSTATMINQLQTETKSGNQSELKLDLSPPFTLFGRARLGIKDSDNIGANTIVNKESEKNCAQHNTEKQRSSCLGGESACSIELSPSEDTVTDQPSSLVVEKVVEQLSDRLEDGDNRTDSSVGCSRNLGISDASIEESETVNKDLNNITESDDERMNTSFTKLSKGLSFSEPYLGGQIDIKKDTLSIGSSSAFNPSLRKLYRSMNVPVPRPLPSLTDLLENCKRAKNNAGSSNTRLRDCYTPTS
ncbi:protein artemis [Canna indica]|uniref:Protein artemis n=1 Tax=Canna indica TaxID=4628 RepID=A0AAQ3Q390_9LILI|nr:protein artemis [Canna indica]